MSTSTFTAMQIEELPWKDFEELVNTRPLTLDELVGAAGLVYGDAHENWEDPAEMFATPELLRALALQALASDSGELMPMLVSFLGSHERVPERTLMAMWRACPEATSRESIIANRGVSRRMLEALVMYPDDASYPGWWNEHRHGPLADQARRRLTVFPDYISGCNLHERPWEPIGV